MNSDFTSQFQLAIPAVIPPSSLTSIHIQRTRRLTSEDSFIDTHCETCANPIFADGSSQIRTVRIKGQRRLRVRCGACGRTKETMVAKGNAGAFPRVKNQVVQNEPAATSASSAPVATNLGQKPQPTPFRAQAPAEQAEPSSKARSKKKSTLQNLLSKNRQQQIQEQKKQSNAAGGGLAAFLGSLS